MCLFPNKNNLTDGPAFKKGVTEFPCGGCPECMQSRANKIMLRDVFEASQHKQNCMCTLTYDTYIRDVTGRIIGEKVSDKRVDKRDCQLFIKRLRMQVLRKFGVCFKYRISAEYGKKTHRPHYHVEFFGWSFPDVVKYKKSKRGNWIYTSAMLSAAWGHGICTVDAVRLSPAIARYCSKYISKDKGVEDTFSLCSQGIGIDALYKAFNGLYYVVEGRRYSIPREVWQRYIIDAYSGGNYTFSTRYVNRTPQSLLDGSYEYAARQRRKYQIIRDHDPLYQAYLQYWSTQAATWKVLERSVFERILALPNDRYYHYKAKALEVLNRREHGIPAIAPRSNSRSVYARYLEDQLGISSRFCFERLPLSSRLYTASDTKPLRNRLKVYDGYGDNPFGAVLERSKRNVWREVTVADLKKEFSEWRKMRSNQ